MNKTIAFADVDGVLLNWEQGFYHYLHDIDMSHVAKRVSDIQNKLRNDSEEVSDLENKLSRAFNLSIEFANLSPYKDSVKYIRKMHEEHGVRLICLTSCGNSKRTIQGRKENLERYFGNAIEDVICLPYRSSKYLALSNLLTKYDPLFWIDDSPQHVLDASALGIKNSFLMANPKKETGFLKPVMKNWQELYLYMSWES